MTTQWEGCQVSNRLNLRYDDDMNHWPISGRDDHVSAMGSGAELVRMALSILENLPDQPENGPALDVRELQRALPIPVSNLIARVVELETRPPEWLDQKTREMLAGALIAAGTQMLRQDGGKTWSTCREPRFAFRMEIDAGTYWDTGEPPEPPEPWDFVHLLLEEVPVEYTGGEETALLLACGLTDRDDHGSHLVAAETLRPGGDCTTDREQVDCPSCLDRMAEEGLEADRDLGERQKAARARHLQMVKEQTKAYWDDDLPF